MKLFISIIFLIAKFLEIFDLVIATDGDINLKGINKLQALNNRFEKTGFDYIGDSTSDLVIWQKAIERYVVNPTPYLMRKLKMMGGISGVFSTMRRNLFWAALDCLRPYQWIKNILVFLPLLTAHKYGSQELIEKSFFAFLAFCMLSKNI